MKTKKKYKILKQIHITVIPAENEIKTIKIIIHNPRL